MKHPIREVASGLLLAAMLTACSSPRQSRTQNPIDAVITRDLNRYFSKRQGVPVIVGFSYLRKAPTITGIAYPKYYLWVTARDSARGTVLVEGATRIAQIDSAVEVTHFLPREDIAKSPTSLDAVFPTAVIPEIKKHL